MVVVHHGSDARDQQRRSPLRFGRAEMGVAQFLPAAGSAAQEGQDGAAALSPWPEADTAQEAAIARLQAAVAGRTMDSDEETSALGALASARVEREARGAPQAIRDEAVIRYAGYMAGADYGALRGETIGPRSIEYVANHANAWRNCGAAGLLAPWRIRRAGVIA